MKVSKKWRILFVFTLLLTSCKQENEHEHVIVEPVKKGEYGFYLPYEDSSANIIHDKYGVNKKDTYFLGEQALELAKEHFDPKSVYAREGSVISAEELERFDANYRGLGLLKYMTEYNPEGLNPEKGNYVPSGSGIDMYNAILVSDVREIDFVDKEGNFVGFQFTIVLNETVSYSEALKNADGTVKTDKNGDILVKDEEKTAKLSTDQLFNYGSLEAGQRLVSYLRNNHPEVGNLPIQVLLYKTTSADSMTSGSFIGKSYVTTRASTSYEKLNQEWVFAPSNRLDELNSILADQISSVKNELFKVFPNEIDYYGRVFFQDNMAQEVEIEVNVRGKTYVEIHSLVQYMVSKAPSISENKVELNINVKNEGQTVALIHRDLNGKDIEVSLV